MLKNIIFILNKEQKIPDSVQNGPYAVAYDSAFAGPDDSIVITDDIETAHMWCLMANMEMSGV